MRSQQMPIAIPGEIYQRAKTIGRVSAVRMNGGCGIRSRMACSWLVRIAILPRAARIAVEVGAIARECQEMRHLQISGLTGRLFSYFFAVECKTAYCVRG